MKKITELPNEENAHLHQQYENLIKTLNEKPDKVKETENGQREKTFKKLETKISNLTNENGNLKAENDTYKNKKIQLENENNQLKEDFKKKIEEKNKTIKDLISIVENANQTQTHHKGELEEEPTNSNVSIALVEDNIENEAPKENINDTKKKNENEEKEMNANFWEVKRAWFMFLDIVYYLLNIIKFHFDGNKVCLAFSITSEFLQILLMILIISKLIENYKTSRRVINILSIAIVFLNLISCIYENEMKEKLFSQKLICFFQQNISNTSTNYTNLYNLSNLSNLSNLTNATEL